MEIEALVERTLAAFSLVEPTHAARLCLAQIETASPEDACALLDVVVGPPRWVSSLELSDEPLARWPQAARGALLRRTRALPPGRERVEALCFQAPWLDEHEKREALDGILDGTWGVPSNFTEDFQADLMVA